AVPASQVAPAVNREAAFVLHALIGKPLDVPREITPQPNVQLVPGHATVDLDRARNRSGDVFDGRHRSQRAPRTTVVPVRFRSLGAIAGSRALVSQTGSEKPPRARQMARALEFLVTADDAPSRLFA